MLEVAGYAIFFFRFSVAAALCAISAIGSFLTVESRANKLQIVLPPSQLWSLVSLVLNTFRASLLGIYALYALKTHGFILSELYPMQRWVTAMSMAFLIGDVVILTLVQQLEQIKRNKWNSGYFSQLLHHFLFLILEVGVVMLRSGTCFHMMMLIGELVVPVWSAYEFYRRMDQDTKELPFAGTKWAQSLFVLTNLAWIGLRFVAPVFLMQVPTKFITFYPMFSRYPAAFFYVVLPVAIIITLGRVLSMIDFCVAHNNARAQAFEIQRSPEKMIFKKTS
jgi:hypothetical protein